MPENLPYVIIGAAMEIHRRLGHWHAEIVYQRALQAALDRQGLGVRPEMPLRLQDKDGVVLAIYRPDLVVRRGRETVVVELKAVPALTDAHVRQLKAYLNAWRGRAEGLLVNFGEARLTWKKVRKERP